MKGGLSADGRAMRLICGRFLFSGGEGTRRLLGMDEILRGGFLFWFIDAKAAVLMVWQSVFGKEKKGEEVMFGTGGGGLAFDVWARENACREHDRRRSTAVGTSESAGEHDGAQG